MGAALDLLLTQQREPALDEIEPGRTGRREMGTADAEQTSVGRLESDSSHRR